MTVMLSKFVLVTGPLNGPVLFCWLSSVVVCNAASKRPAVGSVGTQRGNAAGAWTVGALATGRVVSRPADTARRASRITSR